MFRSEGVSQWLRAKTNIEPMLHGLSVDDESIMIGLKAADNIGRALQLA